VCPLWGPPASLAPSHQRQRRYPSDTTDQEWALIHPLLPPPACTTPTGGRPEAHPRREIVDAIHDTLRETVRGRAGRHPQPSAAIIDSQSVRAADTVPRASRGYDAGKKVNGRKRHLAVDTIGLLLLVMVTAASVQDRDAGRQLLWRLRVAFGRVRHVWADAGYAGRLVAWAAGTLRLRVEIVRKRLAHAFEVLPRRWVVERTLAWISNHRRTVRDYERTTEHSEAMVKWAMTTLMTRRFARQQHPASTPAPTQPQAA
jgi:transposase